MDEGPRSPVKPAEMFSSGTDPTLISRHLQKIHERRMYLSQQQYSRESEERTNVVDQDHFRSNVLPNDQHNAMTQCPAMPVSSAHPDGTSVKDSGSTAPSAVASRPATNQDTANNEQIDRRHDLLMEVLTQFEKRISAKQIKSFDYAKRQLNSNNGVAFDWGKLPRIGTVHSVQGIMGPEEVHISGTNQPNSGHPLSKRRKIKMSELAKLILNGTFDSFLDPDSPEGQCSGNPNTTTGLNNETQNNNQVSNQASRVERRVSDPQMRSSNQDTALNSMPANDVQSYRGNTQQQTTANQTIPSFNQSPARANTYSSIYASHTPNRNPIESCDSQAIHRTIFNTNSVNANGSGNCSVLSNQRTSSNTLYPNRMGYNTSNRNPVTTGVYVDQLNHRTNYNMNTSNLALSSSRNYNLQSNQRPSYNTGTSNSNQIQRPSYNTSLNHPNISHMVNGQTPGVYGSTPVRSSYPRALTSGPRSAPSIRHLLSSIPMGTSTPSAGRNADRQYRGVYSSLRDVRPMDRAVRTARVEPLSNPTNAVQPSPRAPQAITNSTLRNVCSPDHDLTKHDENSCLDCKLLGTCPIKKAVAAAEKEKEPNDSSDEEPELIITKVTTKEAERGPIERIDVDEWASRCSSESVSEPAQVKQEPVDKEEVIPDQEEKNCDINNVVNQMRLMAERLLTDDGFLDMGTNNRNEENSVDKDLSSDSLSIQEFVSDTNAVGRQQVAISERVSAQEGRECVTMSRQTATEGTDGQDATRVCQEAASEETLVGHHTHEDSSDKLVAPEVTEKGVGQDCANMDTNVASEVTEEIIQENVDEDINVDVQTAAEAVHTESNVQEPIASITMEIQTPSTSSTKETLVQNSVAFAAHQESVAQDNGAPEGVSIDTQPVSESTEESRQQDHIANDMNADSQSTFGVTGTDQDTADVTGSAGHDNRHLGSLIKKVQSLERCISSLRERASSVSDPDESEYDKGDRNYEKYLSMEGADVTDQDNNETSLNTENIDNLCGASRGVSRQPSQITDMSLHDKEAMENLERQLEENQEKLRYHTDDVCMRKMYLQERLFLLRKIERISQKYELMSLGNREAMDKLEKSLEINLVKLKTQNVAWIRKNCLKARLMILKKIEKIRRVYGLLPEEPLSLADDVEGRNAQYNMSTIKGIETEIAREANAAVPVHDNNAAPVEVLGQETTTADSLEVPEINDAETNQAAQPLSDVTVGHNAEEVEESTSVTPVTGLNNKTGTEEQDSLAFEEIIPLSEPAFDNVVVKSEGTVQESNVREAFTLEDAINTFVEKPRDRQRETFGEGTSGPPTPDNPPSKWASLQNTNQENRRKQDYSEKSSLKITPNSSTESLPQINYFEVVESTPEKEPKSKQLREIDDLSDEITITVTNTDCNSVHRFPRSFHQNPRSKQFGRATNVDAGASSSSKTIVRREKRKGDSIEEHVAIKKEKNDSEQDEQTQQKEQNYNIWDFIKKYSL